MLFSGNNQITAVVGGSCKSDIASSSLTEQAMKAFARKKQFCVFKKNYIDAFFKQEYVTV